MHSYKHYKDKAIELFEKYGWTAIFIWYGIFFLSIIIQITIFPLFDLHPSIFDSLGIALIFTVVSMTRSALWRRYFRKRRT